VNHDSKEFFFPDLAPSAYVTPSEAGRTSGGLFPGTAVCRPERLERIDGLHRIPAINATVPSRVYAAAPLTELPASLIPYLISCAAWLDARPGDEIIAPDTDSYSHIAIVSGEVEAVMPALQDALTASLEPVRLLNCAADQAIVIFHSIPRGTLVRAVTETRGVRLDSRLVDALRGWMLRCDARRRPGRRIRLDAMRVP